MARVQVTVSIASEVVSQIEQLGIREGRNRSQMLATLVREALAGRGIGESSAQPMPRQSGALRRAAKAPEVA